MIDPGLVVFMSYSPSIFIHTTKQLVALSRIISLSMGYPLYDRRQEKSLTGDIFSSSRSILKQVMKNRWLMTLHGL